MELNVGKTGPRDPDRPHMLETFVPGRSNQYAYKAAVQILRDRRVVFNPLVFLGSSGMGKTHLLQGLVNAFGKSSRNGKAHYTSSHEFATSFLRSLRQKKTARFRSYFRSLSLLALDDFQALSGKRRIQEEFLHTFDALMNRGGRVVIATTLHPGEISGIDERLRQRLLGGLLLRIREPDFPARLSIVRRQSERMNQTLCEGVLEYLARHVRRNVRELIGAVTRLSAYAALEGREIGVREAEMLLADQFDRARGEDLPQGVIKAVCELCRIEPTELLGSSRRRRVVRARKVVFYLLRAHSELSLGEIGELVGGRKASTVRAAVKEVDREIGTEGDLGKLAGNIEERLGLRRGPDGSGGEEDGGSAGPEEGPGG